MSYWEVNCLSVKKLGSRFLILKALGFFPAVLFMKVYIVALNFLGQTHLTMCLLVN